MAEALEEHILRALPDRYKSTHNQVREWEVLLGQELGNYLDRIEESIRGFVSARPKILSILTLFERDESAESILREYVEGRLNGVPLQLLFDDFTRFRGEQHFLNNDAGAEHGDGMDRMDRRSVTMAAEPATNTDTQQAAINMAPPPRPSAPEAPMTPYTPSNPRQNSDAPPMAGPSGQHSVSNSSVRTHVQDTSVPGPHSTGKRLIDNSELEDQHQSLQSPSKRPKTNWSRLLPVIEVSRFVCMYEVVDDDYIFKDARCGSGWLVIRCNIKEIQFVNVPTRFTQHPLENNLALEHFNQKSKCHLGPPKNKYTEEVILQKFAFRVYNSEVDKTDPADEEVEESNHKLRLRVVDKNLPAVCPGEASNKAKCKRRSAKGGPRAGDERAERTDTQETDDSYREELIREVVSFFDDDEDNMGYSR